VALCADSVTDKKAAASDLAQKRPDPKNGKK
jgi:hypothetical protein